MAGKSAWDLIQPGITSFIDSFKPENVPVSQGWKDSAKQTNKLRRKFQDYAPGTTRQKPTTGSSSYAGPGGNPDGSGQGQAQQNPGMGPYQGHSAPITPTVPTRDVQKADGSKGTQGSPGGGYPVLNAATVAQFLQDESIGRGAFSSIQLPGTKENPITGSVPDAVPFGGQETSVTPNTLGSFTSNGATMPVLDSRMFTTELPPGIVSQYTQYGAMSQGNGAPTSAPVTEQGGKQSKENTSRLDTALSDTASMRGPETEESLMRRANAAFLNASNSQEGLRAKEAVLGQFHAGGQTYQLGPNDKLIQGKDGKPLAMDRDAASAYRLGTSTAEQYKDSYKDRVKEALKEEKIVTPKQAENPFAQNPVGATKDFQMNIPAGTLAPGTDRVGQLIDTTIGMNMTPPITDEQIRDTFLNKREPLMRD